MYFIAQGISMAAGLAIGEGISRMEKKDLLPQPFQSGLSSLVNMVTGSSVKSVALAVFSMTIGSYYGVSALGYALQGRVHAMSTLCQWVAPLFGAYHYSIPFLLSAATYLAKRETLVELSESLEGTYELCGKIGQVFMNSVLDPCDILKRAQEDLSEGLKEIGESLGYMVFENDPAVIKKITREINDFEEHLESLVKKMPIFEQKLHQITQILEKTQETLSKQIQAVEKEAQELKDLFAQIDENSSGFLEEALKGMLGYQVFVEKLEEYETNLSSMHELSKKVDMLVSGIALVRKADNEEIGSIRRWNIYIQHTPLPVAAETVLSFFDLPKLGAKALSALLLNKRVRVDDLLTIRRKRIHLSRRLPKAVDKFSRALVLFKQVRKGILSYLIEMGVEKPLAKENWSEERALLERGSSLFEDADLRIAEGLFPNHQAGRVAKVARAKKKQAKILRQKLAAMKAEISN